jgi:hypothetical protein
MCVLCSWLKPYYPTLFFSSEDLPDKYLSESVNYTQESQHKVYDVVVGDRRALGAATKYVEGELKGLITIAFGAMDAWFEEDEQIFGHPKDPYKVEWNLRRILLYLCIASSDRESMYCSLRVTFALC